MKKVEIIGHRGAAGLKLENTAASIKKAVELGVDAVEIDVRLTKDNKLVVCHDASLDRIAANRSWIRRNTLEQLQEIPLPDGSRLLSLDQALRLAADTPVIVELKDSGTAGLLLNVLEKFPKSKVSVASFKLGELGLVRDLAPHIFLYGVEHTKLIEGINTARLMKLDGIGLNYWLLNPLTYRLAKRSKLKIYVYTLNNPLLVRFIHALYPDIAICTDHPERFIKQKRRRLKARRKKKS